jgi:ABC-type amino acid transport substrate-binding protein
MLLLACCPLVSRAAPTATLIYPRPVSESDHRSEYPLKLLELALAKSGHRYQLSASDVVMNKARVAAELARGTIDVGWMVSSQEREETLLPVRICIFKGLGGWRIALVRKESLPDFARIRTLGDLQQYTAGQQQDWPDTPILQHNGISVSTTSSYDPLFRMLAAGRFEWFPRSIMEVWAEADNARELGLVVEPHVLIRYPSVYYFFVNKKNPALARQIETGLEKALKDGSFDHLLREYHGDVIAKARLNERLVIDLPNPFLPQKTQVKRKELWFQLKDG